METRSTHSGLQIGVVAARSGLSVDTIRFYEKQRLLAKPLRSTGGFRLYTATDVERLSFVSRAQSLGFSLDEIRELLLLRDTRAESCLHVHDLIDQKLASVQEKIADLRTLEQHLQDARSRCDQALAKDCTAGCPVIADIARTPKETS